MKVKARILRFPLLDAAYYQNLFPSCHHWSANYLWKPQALNAKYSNETET